MISLKRIFFLVLLCLLTVNPLFADVIYFIDFTKVLNQSVAGADAQNKLKNKFESESVKFKKLEEGIKKQESDVISQRKVISEEDYKKKLNDLRKQVSELQKNQQISLSEIAKSRAIAKQNLLMAVNPILKKYMEDNKIRIVIDKQSVILGDSSLELTDKIIELLNKEVKSIKLN